MNRDMLSEKKKEMIIRFPRDIGQRHYGVYYKFLFNLLEFMKLDIKLYEPEQTPHGFVIRIGNKRILIDFNDFLKLAENHYEFDVCFKYHYSREYCGQYENVHPIGTISFHDWEDYFTWGKNINYLCNTDRILNNQKTVKGDAFRRAKIREMLKDKYGDLLDNKRTDRWAFWKKINDCLVSVCVPGQRKDILDRGQFQYMAFGACTISPRLNIVLPYMKKVEPGIHYIECADDYSDLVEIIELCKHNRAKCIQVGQNAKKLFSETSVPNAIWQWMNIILKKEKWIL